MTCHSAQTIDHSDQREVLLTRQWYSNLPLIFLLMVLPLSISAVVQAEPLPFKAKYKANYRGIPVSAEGVRELTRISDNKFKLTAIVKSMFISITEESVFSWSPEQRLVPLEYQYRRRGIGSNRDAILKFDWTSHTVLNNVQSKPWKMPIPDGVLDKLVYQLQIRSDLEFAESPPVIGQLLDYQIADGGKLKTYQFKVLDQEQIDTPVGILDTIKLVRNRANKKRSTVFWLAKDWHYLLVQLTQIESGKPAFNLFLEKARIDGKIVGGK